MNNAQKKLPVDVQSLFEMYHRSFSPNVFSLRFCAFAVTRNKARTKLFSEASAQTGIWWQRIV